VTLANNKHIKESDLRKLHDELTQWAHYCVNFNQELARDVVQQSYLKLVDGKAVFDKNSSLKTWLFGVVRLTSLELLRKQRLYVVYSNDTADEQVDELQEEENPFSYDDYTEQQILEAIGQLSLMQREIIYLAFYRDLTMSEIAKILDVSNGTIKTQYHRAKIKLRSILAMGEDNGKFSKTTNP